MGIIIRALVRHHKLEDFNSLLNFNVDDFTPSGTLCYYNDNADSEVVTLLPTTPLQEHFNLRWYIEHLTDECEYDYDSDDLNNPLSEVNWLLQTRGKFMEYVINNGHGHTMMHKQLNRSPVMPRTRQRESAISSRLSEDSIFDTPTRSSKVLIPIKTPQVPTVFIKSRHDDADSSAVKLISEFESPQENGEQITAKDNKLLTTNFTVGIQDRNVEALITYP